MGLNIGSKRILRLGTGSSWTPLDLESTVLWLDPTYGMDAVNDGDVIGSWADRMGRITVVQGTTALKPILKKNIKNGMPVVRIDGVDDYLQAAMAALSQPFHMFAVAINNVNPVIGSALIVDGDDIGHRLVFYINGIATPDEFGFGMGKWLSGGPATTTDWHVWSGHANGNPSELYIDGASAVSGNGDIDNADGLTIGAKYDFDKSIDGDIGDIIICDPALTTAERVQVETWLSNRWSIELA